MDADDIGAAKDGGGDGRGGAAHAIVHATAEGTADEALSRGPDRKGAAQVAELVQTPQDLQIVLRRLAEADPRVQNYLITLDSGPPGVSQNFPEEFQYFLHDVAVLRVPLHRARRAFHVHEDDGDPGPGGGPRHRGVAPQRADVVEDPGAGPEGRPGDRGLR